MQADLLDGTVDNSQSSDRTVIDGIEDQTGLVGHDDLLARREHVVPSERAVKAADVERIDLRVHVPRAPRVGLVERRDGRLEHERGTDCTQRPVHDDAEAVVRPPLRKHVVEGRRRAVDRYGEHACRQLVGGVQDASIGSLESCFG